MEHREPFERRLLVGGIVIDVGVRIPTQTIDHEIRRLLEGRLFLVPIVCPERVKSLLAAVARADPDQRSDERRVGNECVSTGRSRGSPDPYQKKKATH